jgi:glycolate oxidase FAD binding subunit
VLLEVSLKCLPAPKMEATRLFECTAEEAIRWCNEWGGQPLPLSATCYYRGRLAVRMSGAPAAVRAATARLGGEALRDADGGGAFWRGVRDHSHPFFAAIIAGAPLWRSSVRSTAPVDDPEADTLIEWGGALRWRAGRTRGDDRAEADTVRAWAKQHGGHATLFRGADRRAGAFDPLSEVMAELHRRLKAVFDPAGIFNRGRLYPAF